MKKLIVVISVLLFQNTYSQQIDTKSITAYWQMVEYLKKNKPLTDSIWQSVYNLAPNKLLFDQAKKTTNPNFKDYDKNIRKAWEIIYMPSNKKLLDSIIKNVKEDDYANKYNGTLYLYNEYAKQEEKLKEFTKIITAPNYLSFCKKKALEMMPKNFKTNKSLDTLKIYIHCISGDGWATGKEILFGLSGLYKTETIALGALIGHEIHHIVRGSLDVTVDEIPKKDEFAVYALYDCLNEGSADLINVKYTIKESKFLQKFELEGSEIRLKTLDNWFAENSKSTLEVYKTNKDVNKLFEYSGGHNPGYFMALVIERNGFLNELKENIGNPFYFFNLYQKAAKSDKLKPFVFGVESEQYVKTLAEKYSKK